MTSQNDWRRGDRMRTQRLGQALFEVGGYSSGGAVAFLLFCGGAALWGPTKSAGGSALFGGLAWALVVALVGGLPLLGVGYVLRETADDGAPDLAARVKALEAEVAELRAHAGLPPKAGGPTP